MVKKAVLIFMFLTLYVLLLIANISRQDKDPQLVWQKCLGGSDWETGRSIQQTTDGGYIIAGESNSVDGDVTGNHGGFDFWIVQLDASGDIIWQKCLGGSGNDYPTSIQETQGGGYVVAGYTNSTDGDVTGNHGGFDFWIVKLNTSGNILWQRCLGGSGNDYAMSIHQTIDGGYIVAGYSDSNDGHVTNNRGGFDFWIVKLNASGNIVWQKSLGGSSSDYARSVQQTNDGGYIVTGNTYSIDGDVTGHHGDDDVWVVRLSSTGSIIWQKCLGGSDWDRAYSTLQASDGTYMVAGYTKSTDGSITTKHDGFDFWIVKLDTSGKIVWQRCLGGNGDDHATSIWETKSGDFVVAGYTNSTDGDVTGNHGGFDFWVIKLDKLGNLMWQKCLGGNAEDIAYSIQQTLDGGGIVAGHTISRTGDVSDHRGWIDFWVVKLQ